MNRIFLKHAIWLVSGALLMETTAQEKAPKEAKDPTYAIEDARTAFRDGNFDEALKEVEPLLKLKPPIAGAREIAAAAYQNRGVENFQKARIKESIADFDRFLEFYPEREPHHWQRGISYYYAEEYEKGV